MLMAVPPHSVRAVQELESLCKTLCDDWTMSQLRYRILKAWLSFVNLRSCGEVVICSRYLAWMTRRQVQPRQLQKFWSYDGLRIIPSFMLSRRLFRQLTDSVLSESGQAKISLCLAVRCASCSPCRRPNAPYVRHSSSSTRWKTRQGNDFFAREARVQGLKSRAAFKLLEVVQFGHM